MPRFGDIPTGGGQPPSGTYIATIGIEKAATKTNKLCWNAEFAVKEPVTEAGSVAYDMFVVGTDDDPKATDQETWNKSVGARRFRGLLKAANVVLDDDSEAEEAFDQGCEALNGADICISVEQETEPEIDRFGNPNQYAGKKRSRIVRFYPLGTVAPGVSGTAAAANGAKPATRPSTAAPAKAAAPARPATASPQRPAAARPASAAAPRPSAPPPPAAGAKKPAAATIALACGHTVPRNEVGSHADTCEVLNAAE